MISLLHYDRFEMNTLKRLAEFAELYHIYKKSFESGDFGYKDGGKIHVARLYKEITELHQITGFSNKVAREFGRLEIKEAYEKLINTYSIELIPVYV